MSHLKCFLVELIKRANSERESGTCLVYGGRQLGYWPGDMFSENYHPDRDQFAWVEDIKRVVLRLGLEHTPYGPNC